MKGLYSLTKENIKEIREEMRQSCHEELDDFDFLVDHFAAEEDKNLDYGAQLYKEAIIDSIFKAFAKVTFTNIDILKAQYYMKF